MTLHRGVIKMERWVLSICLDLQALSVIRLNRYVLNQVFNRFCFVLNMFINVYLPLFGKF